MWAIVFIGREAELAALADQMERAAAGEPRVVLIEGDAGVGKSSLLAQFASGLGHAVVFRAAGEESEMLLPYGVLEQLTGGEPREGPGSVLAAGAELVAVLGAAEDRFDRLVVVLVDDLHWADLESGGALLFAFRRLRADRVLAVVSARADELARLGEGWARFAAGDGRVVRVRLAGFGPGDLVSLAKATGVGELPRRVVASLLEHTGGNPLYCHALLEELSAADLANVADVGVPAPRALASVIVSRVSGLSPAARELVLAAAVLGEHSRLAAACALAGLADPGEALAEAEAAGVIVERRRTLGRELRFVHPLVRRAVYDDLSVARRRELHARAATLVDPADALEHRVAATATVDDGLAAELEQAAVEVSGAGGMTQAARWLTQAAALSREPAERERRLLGAIEQLLSVGDVAGATALEPDVRAIGGRARASGVLGHLALLRDRPTDAERLLLDAWKRHDRESESLVGAAAAMRLVQHYTLAGRADEALRWAGRAMGSVEDGSPLWPTVPVIVGGALAFLGRPVDGLELLEFLPANAGDVPLAATDALVFRGVARLWTGDVRGALRDLRTSAARLRDGAPLQFASPCLGLLGDAAFRSGEWDDAVVHSELAVSLAADADRVYHSPFVHGYAAMVPAHRGEWEVASGHVRTATAAAQRSQMAHATAISNTAAAMLAAAKGDHAGVLEAAAAIRATGRLDVVGHPGIYNWRAPEIDALIALGRVDEAAIALDELRSAIPAGGLQAASVALARMQGTLAAAEGDHSSAEGRFAEAWRFAEGLGQPFELAVLALADGRRLRKRGERAAAIARLRDSHDGFANLRARPYEEACERELEVSGVAVGRHGPGAVHGLTPAELAVARLVATGKTNRQTAEELYVTVKTVEFHLHGVFAKLGISSRAQIAERLGPSAAE